MSGILREKFPKDGIERVLGKFFGEAELKDAITNLLITSYDMDKGDPFFFKSERAKNNPVRNFLMWHAARATSAAPTYFQTFKPIDHEQEFFRSLVDGGIFANNPAMCAYAEAVRDGFKDLVFVSLGTGVSVKSYPFEKVRNWGVLQWIKPLIDVMMDGNNDTVEYQMNQLMSINPKNHYQRFQMTLPRGYEKMDDASPANIRRLSALAKEAVEQNREQLKEACAKLLEVNADRPPVAS